MRSNLFRTTVLLVLLIFIMAGCKKNGSSGASSPPLSSLVITPANPVVSLNATRQFTATGTYSDNSTKDLTSSATWNTSNPAIATINSTGLASMVSAGTATITATSGNISGKTAITAAGVLDFSGDMSRVDTFQVDQTVRNTTFPDVLKLRAPAIDAARGRIYLSGVLSPYILVLDKSTLRILDTIDTGLHGYLGKQLAINQVTGILYYTVLENGQLVRVDPVAKKVSPPVSVSGGGAVVVDEVNDRVYAAAKDQVRVYNGNLSLLSAVTATGVIDIKVAPETNRLYVVNTYSVTSYDVSNLASITLVKTYSLPAGFLGSFVTAANGNIYVSCKPKAVFIIPEDGATAPTRLDFDVEASETAVAEGSLFVFTGYPYTAGYLPDDDAAYSVIEVYDATTLAHQRSIKTGMQGSGLVISGTGADARLYFANTGEATLSVVDLTGAVQAKVDTGTSIEDLVVRPSDGALIARNRLGGSTLMLVQGNSVSDAPAPGNWPTKTLADPQTGIVYTLSHYQSSVSSFDLATLAPLATLDLGVQRLRTDALSTMALDSTARRLYVALPELGQVVAVNLNTGTAEAPISVPGFDIQKADATGSLQVAANSALGLVYVVSAAQKMLFVYDSALALVRSLDLAASYPSPVGGNPLDFVVPDEAASRLFVGSLVLDAQGTTITGQLAEGSKVIGIYTAGNRLYATSFVPPATPGQEGHEQLVELDATTLAVTRCFDLSPINYVKSAFAFDFNRGLAYAGYFETGAIDVIRFAAVR